MNPLNHFGIKNIMIRGDTSSYNRAGLTCPGCGKVLYTAKEAGEHYTKSPSCLLKPDRPSMNNKKGCSRCGNTSITREKYKDGHIITCKKCGTVDYYV